MPDGAFTKWSTGDRECDECTTLVEIAAGFNASSVKALHKHLKANITSGGAAGGWQALKAQGLQPERFLALMMALLSSSAPGVEAAAAGCLLTAMRVTGAVPHGVFHPIAFFDLTKALRSLLCEEARTEAPSKKKAAPAKKKPAKRGAKNAAGERDDDDDDDDDYDERDAAAPRGGSSGGAGTEVQDALLSELESLLRTVPLRSYPEPLSQVVDVLSRAAMRRRAAYQVEPLCEPLCEQLCGPLCERQTCCVPA